MMSYGLCSIDHCSLCHFFMSFHTPNPVSTTTKHHHTKKNTPAAAAQKFRARGSPPSAGAVPSRQLNN